MRACWVEDPSSRPSFEYISKIFQRPVDTLLAYADGSKGGSDGKLDAQAATGGLAEDEDKLGTLTLRIVDMLQTGIEFEVIKACMTLQSLAKMADTARYFADHGGLDPLSRYVLDTGRLQEESIRALGALCNDSHATARAVSLGVFPDLVQMSRGNNEVLRTIVLKTLSTAAQHSKCSTSV